MWEASRSEKEFVCECISVAFYHHIDYSMAVKATQKNISWQKNTFFLFLFICWLPVLKIPNDKDSILSVTMCHTHIICLFFVKFRSRIFPGILYFQLLFLKDSHRKKSQHKPRYWAIEMGNWSISLYGSKIMGDEDDNNKWRWYIYIGMRGKYTIAALFLCVWDLIESDW